MLMDKEHIASYKELQKKNEALQQETVQIKDLKEGDILAEWGYAFHISEIIGVEKNG